MNGKLYSFFSATLILFAPYAAQAIDIERLSVSSAQIEAVGDSIAPAVSADGSIIAFSSFASGLVSGDTNQVSDIFVRDRNSGVTSRISVGAGGREANQDSYNPVVSANGRFVVFESFATNLVSGDTNDTCDIFLVDRETGQLELISVASDGTPADGISTYAAISADGRFVVFQSSATNLVAGGSSGSSDIALSSDIFLRDRETHTTKLISRAYDGSFSNGFSSSPSISANGRFIAFQSDASNLVPNDTNGDTGDFLISFSADIFLYDSIEGVLTRVSIASDGREAHGSSETPSISADGRYIAFSSNADNFVGGDTNTRYDVYMHDRITKLTTLVSTAYDFENKSGDDESYSPRISSDGRFVVFSSFATDLAADDTNDISDIFVRDMLTGRVRRASIAFDGSQALGDLDDFFGAGSFFGTISSGNEIIFESLAPNLVRNDLNESSDVFVVSNVITDLCPADLRKTAPGTCGCGVEETDDDLDGIGECRNENGEPTAIPKPGKPKVKINKRTVTITAQLYNGAAGYRFIVKRGKGQVKEKTSPNRTIKLRFPAGGGYSVSYQVVTPSSSSEFSQAKKFKIQ